MSTTNDATAHPDGGGTGSPDSVERWTARAQIHEILSRYAYLAKENADWDAMVPLFTPDGTFTLPNGHTVGCREISTIVAAGQPDFIRHHLTTVQIDFTGDDTAVTDAYFIAYTHLAQPDHWGRWRDRFVRGDDGRWLLANKTVVVEGWVPDSFWARLVGQA